MASAGGGLYVAGSGAPMLAQGMDVIIHSGSADWDGKNDQGQLVSGGMYYLKVETTDPFGKVDAYTQALNVQPRKHAMLEIFNSAGELLRSQELPTAYLITEMTTGSEAMVPASSGGSLKITVRDAQGGQSDWHWDGKNDRGLEVDSGVYSVRVTSEREGGGKVVFARQVQLLKGQARRSLEGAHASPNPWASGKGALQIHFEPQDAWLSASLYSLAGERVAQAGGHGASGSLTLSAPGLAGGIYLLRLQRGPGGGSDESHTLKIAVLN
jgi:flagellar hook assembly protein FlgD